MPSTVEMKQRILDKISKMPANDIHIVSLYSELFPIESTSDPSISQQMDALILARREKFRRTKRTFKEIVSVPSVDMKSIYPLQQRAVKAIHDVLYGDSRIDRVLLFGSSVTMACTQDSDLDLMFFMNDTSNEAKLDVSEKAQIACNWNADILWSDTMTEDDRVFKDAIEMGSE